MSATDTTLGPYVLERELGRGAFGVVYRGHHEARPDTLVAIKTVEAHGDLDRMLVEPALLARLKHPCIVGLEEYFVHEGKLVLALEFVPGEDLKAYLDRGESFGPDQVRDLLAQLGSALAEAHAQQVVHRDIKPSNVLVDTSGGRTRYVLTDFGVGRTAEGVQSEKHVGGTYLYMAPEQLRGRPGPQSDLWALGVVAYQMLTGRLPFPGPTLAELAKQIQYTDPPPPSEVRGEPVPADLEAAVLGLLRKSLSERTASAAELLRQLGVRGDTKRVIDTRADTRRSAVRSALPLAQKLTRDARWHARVLGVSVALYVLPKGILAGALVLAGLWLFYHAQANVRGRGRRAGLTAAAIAVLAGPQLAPAFVPALQPVLAAGSVVGEAVRWGPLLGPSGQILIGLVVAASGLANLLLPVFGSAAYAELRRLRREQALLKGALAGQTESDEYLRLMRDMVDTRIEDVGFHLRYAELLYARGDHAQAAVEARLITVQDPYHFNANLLLANAYYALRLYDDCRAVCAEYLEVAGYCFEFQELKEQCEGRLARP